MEKVYLCSQWCIGHKSVVHVKRVGFEKSWFKRPRLVGTGLYFERVGLKYDF